MDAEMVMKDNFFHVVKIGKRFKVKVMVMQMLEGLCATILNLDIKIWQNSLGDLTSCKYFCAVAKTFNRGSFQHLDSS